VLAHEEDQINETTWYYAGAFVILLLVICLAWWMIDAQPFYEPLPSYCKDHVFNVRIVADDTR
jgi:hypothetical protein